MFATAIFLPLPPLLALCAITYKRVLRWPAALGLEAARGTASGKSVEVELCLLGWLKATCEHAVPAQTRHAVYRPGMMLPGTQRKQSE